MAVKKICIIKLYHCQHNQPCHVTSQKKKKETHVMSIIINNYCLLIGKSNFMIALLSF